MPVPKANKPEFFRELARVEKFKGIAHRWRGLAYEHLANWYEERNSPTRDRRLERRHQTNAIRAIRQMEMVQDLGGQSKEVHLRWGVNANYGGSLLLHMAKRREETI
jgi:hypothetical protein